MTGKVRTDAGFSPVAGFWPRGLYTATLRAGLPVVLWIMALLQAAILVHSLKGQATRNDFSIYYLSGRTFYAGANPYRTNFHPLAKKLGLDDGRISQATDPPTFILLFSPISQLPPQKAFWLWTAINFAAFAIALFILLGPGSGLSGPVAWSLAALVAWYPPVADHFFWGQNKILVLTMLVLMMRCMASKRDVAAGLIFALASLTRIFPLAIMGYLVLQRRWRTLAYTAIGLVAGAVLTMIFFGAANTLSFGGGVDFLTNQHWLFYSRNLAMNAFISRFFWRLIGPHLGAAMDALRRASILAADVAVLGLATQATLTSKPGADPDWRIFSLWVATAVMLSPTAWIHYLVILLIPFAQITSAAFRGRGSRRAIWMAIASIALIVLSMDFSEARGLEAHYFIRGAFRESAFMSMLAGFVAAYWFAIDGPDASELSIWKVPAAAWRRVFYAHSAGPQSAIV
jgi:hypothetical protein